MAGRVRYHGVRPVVRARVSFHVPRLYAVDMKISSISFNEERGDHFVTF